MAVYKVKNPFRSAATGKQYKVGDDYIPTNDAAVKSAIAADVIHAEPVKAQGGKPAADNTGAVGGVGGDGGNPTPPPAEPADNPPAAPVASTTANTGGAAKKSGGSKPAAKKKSGK